MTGLVVGCALGGLVLGVPIWVAVERIPDRRSLRAPPFPEVRDVPCQPLGVAVVVGSAGLFAGIAARLGDVWELPAFLVLAAGLLVLSAIDLRHYILPNRVVYPLTTAVLVLLGGAALADGDADPFLRALGCGAGAFVAFTALHVISPRALGFGDVRLSFVLGLSTGWLGVGETVVGLFLGFVYGALLGVLLIVTHVRSRKDHVPFGPFLAAGAVTAILVGDTIVDWYQG